MRKTFCFSWQINKKVVHLFYSEFLANREPNFLKTGKLVVDRLHVKNHINCSRGYNSDLYPDLKGVNTQRCEQLNSEIKRLNSMISYCKPHTAWKILNLYMSTKNYIRACSENKSDALRGL